MILYLDERISKETVEKISQFYDKHPRHAAPKEYSAPTIYLSSGGGDFIPSQIITDIINSRPDTILIGSGFLGSAGFEIFFETNCHKKLLPGTIGMMHQSVSTIELNESGQACYKEGVAKKEQIKTFLKPRTLALCQKLGMTDKEIRQITKDNSDLYFQYPRMMKFLEKVSPLTGC